MLRTWPSVPSCLSTSPRTYPDVSAVSFSSVAEAALPASNGPNPGGVHLSGARGSPVGVEDLRLGQAIPEDVRVGPVVGREVNVQPRHDGLQFRPCGGLERKLALHRATGGWDPRGRHRLGGGR